MELITYIQIALAGLLIISILLQQKGSGLSPSLGGSFFEYSTKRGAEKMIFYATIVIAVLFFSLSIARLLV